MGQDKCKKCGKKGVFSLGLCSNCFGNKYKCNVCGKPLHSVAGDIAFRKIGISKHTKGYTYMCMSCRTVGHELTSKFR